MGADARAADARGADQAGADQAGAAQSRPPPGAAAPTLGPGFDQPVPPGGYLWWYLDAISDDGRHALCLIAFIGSVFSPYYAWAGRRDPQNHCAINIALYGRQPRWAMTERGHGALARTPHALAIGPSSMAWHDGGLDIHIAETATPWPSPVRGQLRLSPGVLPARSFDLDDAGRHRWQPVAPLARITVALQHPCQAWQGDAYFDSNAGSEPLGRGFAAWHWARGRDAAGALITYDRVLAGGAARNLALHVGHDGALAAIASPGLRPLPPGLWRVAAAAPADAGSVPQLQQRLEDAPFYRRHLIRTQIHGQARVMVQESLDATRIDHGLVRAMLPFRMPRAWRSIAPRTVS